MGIPTNKTNKIKIKNNFYLKSNKLFVCFSFPHIRSFSLNYLHKHSLFVNKYRFLHFVNFNQYIVKDKNKIIKLDTYLSIFAFIRT